MGHRPHTQIDWKESARLCVMRRAFSGPCHLRLCVSVEREWVSRVGGGVAALLREPDPKHVRKACADQGGGEGDQGQGQGQGLAHPRYGLRRTERLRAHTFRLGVDHVSGEEQATDGHETDGQISTWTRTTSCSCWARAMMRSTPPLSSRRTIRAVSTRCGSPPVVDERPDGGFSPERGAAAASASALVHVCVSMSWANVGAGYARHA